MKQAANCKGEDDELNVLPSLLSLPSAGEEEKSATAVRYRLALGHRLLSELITAATASDFAQREYFSSTLLAVTVVATTTAVH